VVHGYVGDRRSEKEGEQDEGRELVREKRGDVRNGCAQHLTDTDFFPPSLGGVGRRAEESKACDQHRHACEEAEYLPEALLRSIRLVEEVVEKGVVERRIRHQLLDLRLDVSKR